MATDCHVVVVNWNGGNLAVQSAVSVCKQSVGVALWVVDNGSTDGSCVAIQEACPDVRLIHNRGNAGYAAANNQALKACSDASYILLLNNDAILPDSEGLAEAIRYLKDNPSVQGVCGRYEYPGGEFQRFYNRLPNAQALTTAFGIGRYVPALRHGRTLRRFHMLDEDFDQPMRIEQPAFACVLMKGDCFRAVGLFDEQFPIFFNDVDYCWRWREAGFCWDYLPSWRVVHEHGGSTRRLDSLLGAEMAGSAVRFAKKHLSRPAAMLVQFAVLLDAVWNSVRGRLAISPLSISQGKHVFSPHDPLHEGSK